ncbi:hypothetical protein PE36_12862 [Moritella sp. PE36]|uniref:hypothetical protein n=1 Tax=Moritella sp. PE36 TaxID=58051 RepID=UPI0001568CB4|nr:hypothetical protein [Moritella sp. PE36]EDM65037.1 hypothetical protein PE36_12862 [Moritella sp. PE36]
MNKKLLTNKGSLIVTSLVASVLAGCDGSTGSEPVIPDPVQPIENPCYEGAQVCLPVELPYPDPVPDCEDLDNCDVSVIPIDIIVEPIEDPIIIDPIEGEPFDYCEELGIDCDVTVEPIEGEKPCYNYIHYSDRDGIKKVTEYNSCTSDYAVVETPPARMPMIEYNHVAAVDSSDNEIYRYYFFIMKDAWDGIGEPFSRLYSSWAMKGGNFQYESTTYDGLDKYDTVFYGIFWEDGSNDQISISHQVHYDSWASARTIYGCTWRPNEYNPISPDSCHGEHADGTTWKVYLDRSLVESFPYKPLDAEMNIDYAEIATAWWEEHVPELTYYRQ